jgi:hypothetical protein
MDMLLIDIQCNRAPYQPYDQAKQKSITHKSSVNLGVPSENLGGLSMLQSPITRIPLYRTAASETQQLIQQLGESRTRRQLF